MSRFDIITERKVKDEPVPEKPVEFLKDFSLGLDQPQTSHPELRSFVEPNSYAQVQRQNNPYFTIITPAGRHMAFPVEDIRLHAHPRGDISFEVSVSPELARSIEIDIRETAPRYFSTQDYWERERHRDRERNLMYNPQPIRRAIDPTAWRPQPPGPGELSAEQMRRILE